MFWKVYGAFRSDLQLLRGLENLPVDVFSPLESERGLAKVMVRNYGANIFFGFLRWSRSLCKAGEMENTC